MRPTMRLGLEEGFTRRGATWTAVGLWAVGFVLAGAAAERMGHAAFRANAANPASIRESEAETEAETERAVACGAPCDARASDDSSSGDPSTIEAVDAPAMFFPEDTLVVFTHPLPAVGVAQMQSPQ